MKTPTPNAQPVLQDKKTMAQMLNISPRHLFNETRAGKIPAVRIGNRVLYDPQDVLAAVKADKLPPE